MAKIRTYEQQIGIAGSIDSRRANADDFGAQIGDAMVRAGASMDASAGYLREKTETDEITRQYKDFAQAQADWAQQYTERVTQMKPDDPSFVPTLKTDMEAYFEKMRGNYKTPQGRERFERFAATTIGDFQMKGIASQSEMAAKKASSDWKSTTGSWLSLVRADPNQYEYVTGEARKALDDPMGAYAKRLDIVGRDTLFQQFKQEAAFAVGKSMAVSNPQGLLNSIQPAVNQLEAVGPGLSFGPPSAASYAATLGKIENASGDPNAVPRDPKTGKLLSSARGFYQWTNATAQQYGLLGDGFDYRGNKEKEDAALEAFTRDNRAKLFTVLGREPTNGELYLAHQQGAEGAAALLKNPNAMAADLVGAEAVKNNGGKLSMTAGEFAQKWIGKFNEFSTKGPMLDQPPVRGKEMPDWFNDLSWEQQIDIISDAQQAENKDYAQKHDEFRVAISRGEIGLAELDGAYNEGKGWLKAGDYADLRSGIEKMEEERRLRIEGIRHITSTMEGKAVYDPNNKDQKTAYDNYWYDYKKAVAEKTNDPAAADEALVYVSTKMGAIPPTEQDGLVAALQTGPVEARVRAAELISEITDQKPGLASTLDERTLGMAEKISGLVDLGYTPEKAVEAATLTTYRKDTPEYAGRVAEYERIKNDDEDSLTLAAQESHFNSFWRNDPNEFPAAMSQEYDRLLKSYFAEDGMTFDAASKTALKVLGKTWGQTRINGSPEYMKYAPEVIYAVGREENQDWIREQLLDDVMALPGVKEQLGLPAERQPPGYTRVLGALPDTTREDIASRIVVSGVSPQTMRTKTPAYVVHYLDDDGRPWPLRDTDGTPFYFMPDYASSKRAKETQEKLTKLRERRAAVARMQEGYVNDAVAAP